MATLKLKKPADGDAAAPRARTRSGTGAGNAPRGPLRGIAAPRKQLTLAQAQAERAARGESSERGSTSERRPAAPTRPPRPDRPPADRRPPRTETRAPAAAEPPPRRPAPQVHRTERPSDTRPAPLRAAEGDRLSKRMTAMGLSSRREADDWIAAGWVRVDGKPAVLGQRVADDARIEIDPRARNEQAERVTVLLHKPLGYVSGQAEDGHEPAIVLVTAANRWDEDRGFPHRPSHLRHLAPAGRLDIDSTGLLVLTQDGRVAKALVGEDSRVEKEYLVRVRPSRPGALAEIDLARLQHGLVLDDVPLKPAKVSWANEDQLRFVLREGKRRQIRRMCELVGLEVVALKRVRIGSVVLGKLPPGQWRYLRSDESF